MPVFDTTEWLIAFWLLGVVQTVEWFTIWSRFLVQPETSKLVWFFDESLLFYPQLTNFVVSLLWSFKWYVNILDLNNFSSFLTPCSQADAPMALLMPQDRNWWPFCSEHLQRQMMYQNDGISIRNWLKLSLKPSQNKKGKKISRCTVFWCLFLLLEIFWALLILTRLYQHHLFENLGK